MLVDVVSEPAAKARLGDVQVAETNQRELCSDFKLRRLRLRANRLTTEEEKQSNKAWAAQELLQHDLSFVSTYGNRTEK